MLNENPSSQPSINPPFGPAESNPSYREARMNAVFGKNGKPMLWPERMPETDPRLKERVKEAQKRFYNIVKETSYGEYQFNYAEYQITYVDKHLGLDQIVFEKNGEKLNFGFPTPDSVVMEHTPTFIKAYYVPKNTQLDEYWRMKYSDFNMGEIFSKKKTENLNLLLEKLVYFTGLLERRKSDQAKVKTEEAATETKKKEKSVEQF